MILSAAAVYLLAQSCQHIVAPATMFDMIQTGEWHGAPMDDHAIGPPNKDGSHDYGLARINDKNFWWLGLNEQTALDPCRSIAAGAKVLTSYSRYNTGKSDSLVGIAYGLRIINAHVTPASPAIAVDRVRLEPSYPLTQPGQTGHDTIFATTTTKVRPQ